MNKTTKNVLQCRSSKMGTKRYKIDTNTKSPFNSESSKAEESTTSFITSLETIPIEIFRILAKSKFLKTQELGKLLLFVSKSLSASLFHSQNEIWETLLIHRFGRDVCRLAQSSTIIPSSTSTITTSATTTATTTTTSVTSVTAPTILSNENTHITANNNSKCSAERLYHSLLQGEVWPPKEPIRPLKYSPEDYFLIVKIHPTKPGSASFTKVLKGDSIPTFFNNGFLEIEAVYLPFDDDRSVENNWEISIHMMRITDQKCCCLFQSEDAFSDYDYFFFYGKHSCLSMSNDEVAYGQQLLDQLANGENKDVVFEGLRFNVCLNCIVRGCSCGCCEPFSGVITSIRIELGLFTWEMTHDFPRKTTVTFAQLLELLSAWDD